MKVVSTILREGTVLENLADANRERLGKLNVESLIDVEWLSLAVEFFSSDPLIQNKMTIILFLPSISSLFCHFLLDPLSAHIFQTNGL